LQTNAGVGAAVVVAAFVVAAAVVSCFASVKVLCDAEDLSSTPLLLCSVWVLACSLVSVAGESEPKELEP